MIQERNYVLCSYLLVQLCFSYIYIMYARLSSSWSRTIFQNMSKSKWFKVVNVILKKASTCLTTCVYIIDENI